MNYLEANDWLHKAYYIICLSVNKENPNMWRKFRVIFTTIIHNTCPPYITYLIKQNTEKLNIPNINYLILFAGKTKAILSVINHIFFFGERKFWNFFTYLVLTKTQRLSLIKCQVFFLIIWPRNCLSLKQVFFFVSENITYTFFFYCITPIFAQIQFKWFEKADIPFCSSKK